MAADPDTAVLSVAYHGRNEAVTTAFVTGMIVVGGERGERYYNCGYRISPNPVRVTMEALMATTYDQDEVSSPFFRRLRQEGLAKGEAKALVKILASRGIALTDEQHELLASCADSDQLDTWLDRALAATSADEVFMA
jgi:hypothetical protein